MKFGETTCCKQNNKEIYEILPERTMLINLSRIFYVIKKENVRKYKDRQYTVDVSTIAVYAY